ncbi:MAG: alpha/beta fold hydrolase [Patescibacteria group bacterium]|mgnify:FL=1
MKKLFILILIGIVIGISSKIIIFNKNNLIKDLQKKTINSVSSSISIDYLRSLNISSEKVKIEEELFEDSNYKRYIASYLSEGNKVYGLLTVPTDKESTNGFPAIIFNHGYIPPSQYQTTEGYISYVDYLARNGFIVFKIDFRGNGRSEGDPSGSYFSSAYTIDIISALRSLQKFDKVDPKRIGIWGHSMAGNAVLRAMLVSNEFKAGVIWSGAVYSYEDFVKYGINDSSYTHRPDINKTGTEQKNRETSPEIQKIRSNQKSINFDNEFWTSISLTKNIKYLSAPIQINHSTSDPVVNIGYSRDLAKVLKNNLKFYEFYEYDGGGHNINSPYFEQAMEKTVDFFKKNL